MPGPTKYALLAKARECALTAVQVYNNPLIRFKSESFIVLMTIAWTYLLHAYYARESVDYRYRDDRSARRKYLRTADGGYKWWELSKCLSAPTCPLDSGTVNNLRFLLGLRNEIEHHKPPHLDQLMSGRYLACALNFEYWLTTLFGERFSLGDTAALTVQFRDMKPTNARPAARLPGHIASFIARFDSGMNLEEYNDPRFAYRLLFRRKVVSKQGQADEAIEFVGPADSGSDGVDPERWLIKETERPKHRAHAVVRLVNGGGFPEFRIYQHTRLWQRLDAKNPAHGYGVSVEGEWFWYDSWVEEVLRQLRKAAEARAPRRSHRLRSRRRGTGRNTRTGAAGRPVLPHPASAKAQR
jgi:Domain of unknown function (DUF3644)